MSTQPPQRWVVRNKPRAGCGIGCLALVLAFLVVMPIAGHIANAVNGPTATVVILSIPIGTYVLIRLWRRLNTTTTPLCPHCGARTDDRFRICSSCGRVK